jgi:hypothetical protein
MILKEQQTSGSFLAFLNAHVNFCGIGVGVGGISRKVAVRLNIRYCLVTSYNFLFSIFQLFA